MILEVHERAHLMPLFPGKGKYEALKEIRIAKEMISFTPEEVKGLNMRVEKQATGAPQTVWDPNIAPKFAKECPMSEYITSMFRKILSEMEKKGELTESHMSLFEKFVVMYK